MNLLPVNVCITVLNLSLCDITDLFRAVLCHCQPIQMAASVRCLCGQSLQRQEKDWSSSSHLLHFWQCIPVHAVRSELYFTSIQLNKI